MSGIWQERTVKKPEDFHAALWAGSCGITEDFALGYATALYDTEAVDMAAFGMAAEDADLSNMLSALSRALKKGALDAFKAEWLSADRIGGDEG